MILREEIIDNGRIKLALVEINGTLEYRTLTLKSPHMLPHVLRHDSFPDFESFSWYIRGLFTTTPLDEPYDVQFKRD